jgi:heme/copper-type cytochrome/quinol oxidase subunit 2
MVSYSALVLILVLIAVLTLLGVNSAVFAQETTERYLSARIEIWALFYRLMVVAFVIGAVVMGTMTYVIWRFRESHPKNRGDITPAAGGGAHH